MLNEIRADYRLHGSSWKERALWALVVYRIGNWAEKRPSKVGRWFFSKVYGVLNLLSEITTGITMNRSVQIGEAFHIVHSGTIFIHPEVVIGDRVGIMQNITLGTNMGPEVPVIGNDVFIGAGACVLGKVHVGDGARVAANSLVINDVPEGAFAVGVPAKSMKARPVFARPDAKGTGVVAPGASEKPG